ncbi:1-aminocyclopropane-1-carboxylate oxidase homolog 11 [Phtheirospermum japonicum]|uniref:1-aminocyclopropane-1-carboxylate oxidase homolog 11 n=1 Tax=Phtheirospermum japonicum TaxID=374723 RepID=A0A830BJE1_9LAMI|nr:1-aminocyclopropane-1-carboxylate oxidase homolog 11 [Phtheirospermum japonicum]
MSPAMALSVQTLENENYDSLESLYQKGVKHMCDNGIEHVPGKYILPVPERPNVSSDENACPDLNLELPVIDFAELQGPNRAQVLKSLAYACENYGFFQLVNHGIPEEIISNMVNVSKRFFEMPFLGKRELVNHGIPEEIISNMVNVSKRFFEMPFSEREKYMSADMNSPVRYGTSFNQTNDGVFCWRDFLKLVCHPLPDVLPHWPTSPSDFRQLAVCYAKETKILFMMLVEAILESLGIKDTEKKTEKSTLNDENDDEEDEILKELENGSQLMVVNCYPPCPQPDLTLGMPPHSDYGFLTLLLQDRVKGLQIQHQNNWVTVQPVPGSFVVNVGDHLEIFSNGRYKSVLHRVVVNSTNYRISVASLHSFPFTSIVRPSEKLVTEANPRRYKDTDFASFLNYVADDPQGKGILEELEADGIDSSFIVVSEGGNSPFTYIIVDDQT